MTAHPGTPKGPLLRERNGPGHRRGQRALTLPALMHEVQALIRLALPDTAARTLWMFGFQRRLVFFLDQGTLWPKPGPLPHTSHTAATGVTPTSVPRTRKSNGRRSGNRASVPDDAGAGRIARTAGPTCRCLPLRWSRGTAQRTGRGPSAAVRRHY